MVVLGDRIDGAAGIGAAGAIERVRIDPATLAVTYRIIGKEEWLESTRDEEIERVGDSGIVNWRGKAGQVAEKKMMRMKTGLLYLLHLRFS